MPFGSAGVMTYQEAVDYLFGLQMFGVKLGLENMRRLCGALGHPERELRFIHIAGTNGKGSTAALLDAALRACGLRVGLFTSPHLCEVTERVRMAGQAVDQEKFARAVAGVRLEVERLREQGVAVTFFEAMTGVALVLFRDAGIEVVVWETGLGGRLDATNVVEPLCCAITRIDRDHERWLGATLAEIAREKAGILKPGRPAVAIRSGPEPDGILKMRAEELGVALRWVDPAERGPVVEPPWRGQWCRVGGEVWLTRLLGAHQRENLAVALAVLEVVRGEGLILPEARVREGLSAARWPGRFDVQREAPPLVVDGAHNPCAMLRLRETWSEVFGAGPGRIIFGCLAEKTCPELVVPFDEAGREVWVVPVKSGRGATVADAAGLWNKANVRVFGSCEEALAAEQASPEEKGTLATGSLYLVGEVLRQSSGLRDEIGLNG